MFPICSPSVSFPSLVRLVSMLVNSMYAFHAGMSSNLIVGSLFIGHIDFAVVLCVGNGEVL